MIKESLVAIDIIVNTIGIILIVALMLTLLFICVYAMVGDSMFKKERILNNFCSGDEDKLMFMYAEKSKVFHRIKYECIEVNISQLGEKTKKKLYTEVQQPLIQLWKNSDKKDYCVLAPYIQSIAEDVQKAVKNCFNKEDEKILRSRLPVLTESIGKMQDVIREIRGGEADIPFQLVENMNQLQQKS